MLQSASERVSEVRCSVDRACMRERPLTLEISMNHAFGVQEREPVEHLARVDLYEALGEDAELLDDVVHRAALDELEHDVEIVAVLDEVEVADDVWMAQLLEDANLVLLRLCQEMR